MLKMEKYLFFIVRIILFFKIMLYLCSGNSAKQHLNITIMEKKLEFLQSRTAAQLSSVIRILGSDLDYIVRNLETITPDSEPCTITKHDVDCLNVIAFCDSLFYVVNELKSSFQ